MHGLASKRSGAGSGPEPLDIIKSPDERRAALALCAIHPYLAFPITAASSRPPCNHYQPSACDAGQFRGAAKIEWRKDNNACYCLHVNEEHLAAVKEP